jgi:hypothetical protein
MNKLGLNTERYIKHLTDINNYMKENKEFKIISVYSKELVNLYGGLCREQHLLIRLYKLKKK